MSPVPRVTVMGRDIGRREPCSGVGDLDPSGKTSRISASTWTFEGNHEVRVAAAVWRPAELHVSEEHHSCRPPIFERVGENIGIHKRTPRLAGAELPYFSPSMTKPESGLTRVDTYAEEFEFE